MFLHNLKYSFKILFKSKMLIFWTFAFPIILGTFFNMAFKDIENNEKLDIIDIAIVDNENFNNSILYKETFKKLGDSSNENYMFNIKYIDLETSKKLLKDKKIIGYLLIEDDVKIVVNSSGINETIFRQVVDEIIQTEIVINYKVSKIEDSQDINNQVIDIVNDINNTKNNIVDKSSNNLSYTLIEFYTLIAMTCLYGGILGMVSINNNLANMSAQGKRVSASPLSKFKLILSSVISSYITQIIGIILLFIYTIIILKVDYGDNLFLVILLALVGCLAGLSLGIFIATIFKTNDNIKTGIIISISMVGCFLSGMMGITMKYYVDKYVPIINKLNPANMITDGFYSLYYYNTLNRYYFNLCSLLLFSIILIIMSVLSLRRQKYDSI